MQALARHSHHWRDPIELEEHMPSHSLGPGALRASPAVSALCALLALLMLWLPIDAHAFACGAPPSAYIDGNKGRFDDFEDSSGFPIFNKEHCYGNPIFSTDGKDTYTTNPYGNRIMTNSGFGYQCFELAQRYFGFKFNKWLIMPSAKNLCDWELPRGVKRFKPGQGTPVPGDLFVFGAGSCGSSPIHGHVAVVTKVYNEESVQIAQQNMRSERSTIANIRTSCACAFLHAEDNLASNSPRTGTPTDAWGPDNVPEGEGPAHTGGGNLLGEPPNLCRCTSNDPQSVWPLCCKKK